MQLRKLQVMVMDGEMMSINWVGESKLDADAFDYGDVIHNGQRLSGIQGNSEDAALVDAQCEFVEAIRAAVKNFIVKADFIQRNPVRTGTLVYDGYKKFSHDYFHWWKCEVCGTVYPQIGGMPSCNGRKIETCICQEGK